MGREPQDWTERSIWQCRRHADSAGNGEDRFIGLPSGQRPGRRIVRLRDQHSNRVEFRPRSREETAMKYLCNLWLVFVVCDSICNPESGPSSPLYRARPETGNPSSRLPTALRDVRIEQKLDQQLPLDLVFRDKADSKLSSVSISGRSQWSSRLSITTVPCSAHRF